LNATLEPLVVSQGTLLELLMTKAKGMTLAFPHAMPKGVLINAVQPMSDGLFAIGEMAKNRCASCLNQLPWQ
jgi:hypothetical protein